MRVLSIFCTVLLITMCIIMQQQSVEAKPFIFKFFLPQDPARTSSSSSSSSSTSAVSGIDISGILSSKLSFLTRLLQTTNVAGGFNIGFKKLFVNTESTTTKKPTTSTTATTPDVVFEPESSTSSSTKSTTQSAGSDKSTEADILSETIDEDKSENGYDYTATKVTSTTKVITDNDNDNSSEGTDEDSGYVYTTTKITTYKPNSYKTTTPDTGYSYDLTANEMSENEISNEIMTINNQYLPAF